MKYLNIKQTILTKERKYSFYNYGSNNKKIEFLKYWAVYNTIAGHRYEYQFKKLFRTYMNNDIYIDWE
jgi:hypothetical protein